MIKLFDVNLPQITKWELKEKIVNLDPNNKHTLYWLYSEFLLRANRNPWYKKILNEGTLSAIDGKGLHWAMYKTMKGGRLPDLYNNIVVNWHPIARVPAFMLLFFIQLLVNLFNGFWTLAIAKTNFSQTTLNETILGRDFTYDLLKICNIKKYKTMIIGGSNEDDEVSKSLIKKLYPDLDIILWTRKSNSLLMMDRTQSNKSKNYLRSNIFHSIMDKFTQPKPYLTTSNLYESFPDLIDAKKSIIDNKPDIVLVCIGGASGKQEFFVHDIMNDPTCKFILATGLGAAIDHIGGGAQQKLPPQWVQNTSIEWMWRFMDQPYRRARIIDSIFTLYYWTTLHQFTQELDHKKFVALNHVSKGEQSILLSKQRSYYPGRLGYTFPKVNIATNQSIEEAGLVYINKKYGLELGPTSVISIPEKGRNVKHPTSIIKFLIEGCKYTSSQYFVNFFDYRLNQKPNNPTDCLETNFYDRSEIKERVSPDKIQFLR